MRLIDADALKAKCRDIVDTEWNKNAAPTSWADAYESFIEDLEEAPSVDAVEVVRCRDCVYMEHKSNARFCNVWHLFNGYGDEGFCSYGKKKEA